MTEIITRAEANAKGLRYFYTGTCQFGHTSVRYVSSKRCVECQKQGAKTNYAPRSMVGPPTRSQAASRRKHERLKARAPTIVRKCSVCDTQFSPDKSNVTQCSDECRIARLRRYRPRKPKYGACKQCGTQFRIIGSATHCSDGCASLTEAARSRESTRKTRLKWRAAYVTLQEMKQEGTLP